MSLRRNALQIVMIAFSTLGSISLAATYTVRPGETLYGIARAFGSSVAELQRLNKLETPVVKVGQVIVVPETATAKAGAPVSHQVQAGDTLYAIARKYAVNLETLQRFESPRQLEPGPFDLGRPRLHVNAVGDVHEGHANGRGSSTGARSKQPPAAHRFEQRQRE